MTGACSSASATSASSAAVAAAGADVPPRSRGLIALDPAACTSCMLCARECPDWCIHISSHVETEDAGHEGEAPADGRSGPGRAGRDRVVHRLDAFAIDFGLCLYCGICVEVCPFDALFWAPATVPPGGLVDLVAGLDRLDDWRSAVPAAQPLEAGAVPPAPKDSGRGHGGGRRRR